MECCATCRRRFTLKKSTYSRMGGCRDEEMNDGFLCMAFADERVGIYMIGVNENVEMCEMYDPITKE